MSIYDTIEKEHLKHFGKDFPNKTFYVIRRRPLGAGLLSNLHWVLNHVVYAVSKRYIPVVNMENYLTYYNDNNYDGETRNAWEYYFQQPCGYSLKDIRNAKNVILGNSIVYDIAVFPNPYDGKINISKYYDLISKYCKFNTNTAEYIKNAKEMRFRNKKNILGVLHRGTDMKTAKHHYTPPSIRQTIEKTLQVFQQECFDYIFLCTEEQEAVDMFCKVFTREKIILSDVERLKNYDSQSGIVPDIIRRKMSSVYKNGLDYLTDVYLLSQCDGIIAPKVNGTLFALGLNNNGYRFKYIFDLGINTDGGSKQCIKYMKRIYRFIKKILRKIKTMLIKIRNVFYLFFGFISFLWKKKIIFMISGGLGDQMWEYAIGQAIEKKSGLPVYYDVEFYKHGGKDVTGLFNRNWDLERVFPLVTVKKASVYDVFFYKKYLNKKYADNNCGRVYQFIEEILISKQPRYLGEIFIPVNYFLFIEKELRLQFVFDTIDFSEDTIKMEGIIKDTPCTVAIQVRRGDFVTVGADKVTPPEYFYNAIDEIKNLIAKQNYTEITFFVFSNDISFCQNIFSSRNEKFIFVDINDNDRGAEDMYLMSLCRHFIISASSFGWWGAFLSVVDHDKIVITPKRWRTDISAKITSRKLPNGWIGL